MKRIKFVELFVVAILISAAVFCVNAQSGSLDPTFGSGGKVVIPNQLTAAIPHDLVAQSDGKIIGLTGSVANNSTYSLVRLNANGSLDTSFGNNGFVTTTWGLIYKAFTYYAWANAIAIQNINGSERILMAGYAPLQSGKSVQTLFRIDRLMPNGLPDTSFGTNGTIFLSLGKPKDMIVQPDQKIVTVSYDSSELVRLNPNGTLDLTFGNGGKVTSPNAYQVAFDSFNGTIVVAGLQSTRKGNAVTQNASLRRYSPNGNLDTSFGSNGVAVVNSGFERFQLKSVAIDPIRNIVIGGWAENSSVSYRDYGVVRFTSTGFQDASFSGDGVATANFGLPDSRESVALVQSNGKIVLVGGVHPATISEYDAGVVRFNTDGSFDSLFGNSGKTIFDISGNDYVSLGRGGIIQFDPGCFCEKIVVTGGNDFVTTFARLTAY